MNKYDSKLDKQDSKLDMLTEMVKKKMDQNQNSNSLPDKIDKPKAQDPTIVVLNNKKATLLECRYCIKHCGMWTLKHEISSPKLYELLFKTEIEGETALDFKRFYNHMKMFLNLMTRIREELIPDYHSIKMHSEFEEYFFPDFSHPSYYCNGKT